MKNFWKKWPQIEIVCSISLAYTPSVAVHRSLFVVFVRPLNVLRVFVSQLPFQLIFPVLRDQGEVHDYYDRELDSDSEDEASDSQDEGNESEDEEKDSEDEGAVGGNE